MGTLYPAARIGPIIPVGLQQMTLALFGLAIYLFCVHSFKLPIASAGIAIGLLGVLMNARTLTFPPPFIFMSCFLAWCAIGATLSAWPSLVGQALVDYLKILLIFFVAINVAKSDRKSVV